MKAKKWQELRTDWPQARLGVRKAYRSLAVFLCAAQPELPCLSQAKVKAAKHVPNVERCGKIIRDQDGAVFSGLTSINRCFKQQVVETCPFILDQSDLGTVLKSEDKSCTHILQTEKRNYIHL